MATDDQDFGYQSRIFKALQHETRLKLLARLSEGPVSAPEIQNEFEIGPEAIVTNLNELADVGLVESKSVRGPGGRPRKEFRLPQDGIHLEFEITEDEYHFGLEAFSPRREP